MTLTKYILFFLLVLTFRSTSAQLDSQTLDTTISIFWNQKLKVRVQILGPDEMDVQKKNTVLTLLSLDQASPRILFRDSIFAYTLQFKMMDLDGNGLRDLMVYYINDGSENKSYHLYLVDQQMERLIKVEGFEKVFNPLYDHAKCSIYGYESYERKLILRRYIINKAGILSQVIWR